MKVKFQVLSNSELYKTMAEIFYTNTGDSYTHLKEAIKTAFNRNVMTKIKIKKTKKTTG